MHDTRPCMGTRVRRGCLTPEEYRGRKKKKKKKKKKLRERYVYPRANGETRLNTCVLFCFLVMKVDSKVVKRTHRRAQTSTKKTLSPSLLSPFLRLSAIQKCLISITCDDRQRRMDSQNLSPSRLPDWSEVSWEQSYI